MQKTPDFMPEFKANLPRTSHVLSHDFGFTCSTGHLLPVFHSVMSPGDTIKLGFDFNLRTMPLEAAAFADITCHTEYFFVPMQLLYQPFDNVYYNISDQFSDMFNSAVSRYLPLEDMSADISSLYANRAQPVFSYPNTADPVESMGQSAMRLLDMLGYDPRSVAFLHSGGLTDYYPSHFPYSILAYNCIYQYYYRLDARETFDQSSFNLDSRYNGLGSGQYIPLTSYLLKYRPLDSDYFTDVKVSPIVDVLNLSTKNTLHVANQWLTRSEYVSSNPVLIAGRVGTPGTGFSSAVTSSPDRYTVSPSGNIITEFGFAVDASTSTTVPYNGMDINTANIRAMFASEKLWSITGRAKKNYDEQTLAHFGFKVPHDVKHQITCFGKDLSKIHVGEVISTANTSLSPLGEIAGKGYGQQQSTQHSFTAPCHGVVMAIFSVTLQHNYEAGQLKANFVTDKNDFFIPEYDHLGMQPLFGYETDYFAANGFGMGEIVGWQYRYEQWKRRFNRTTAAFRNVTGSLRSWIPTYKPYGGPDLDAFVISNPANVNSYKAFLNYPQDVNQIFLGQYSNYWSSSYESDTTWSAIYDNDPFVVNSHINAVLVSTMSDYSLPRLDA